MHEHNGWIGLMREVNHYLRTVGADKDENGKFLVSGGIAAFLGMDAGENTEVVIPGDASYYSRGKALNLAGGLRSTSYGLAVMVF